MLQLTNDIFTLIAQIAVFVFSVGIAIFALRFPIIRECAKEGSPEVPSNQYDRLKNKTFCLFGLGTITIFYSIISKIVINQVIVSRLCLWCLLVPGLLLLAGCFFLLYRLLGEI
jgi:hypothetical protein